MSGGTVGLRGLDVSKWQGQIDWSAVKADGYDFVLIKATEGDGYTDPNFVANWDGARAAGLIVFAYHFMRPDLGNSPEAEVSWFLSQVNFLPGTGAMLDAEAGNGDLFGWVLGWLRNFEARAGFRPMMYSGRWFMDPRNLTGHSELGAYGLDLAQYDFDPNTAAGAPGWQVVAMKQFSNQGRVSGISGDVDLDEFYGDSSALAAYVKGGHPVADIVLSPFSPPVAGRTYKDGTPTFDWNTLQPAGTEPNGVNMTYSEAKQSGGVWYVHIDGSSWAIKDDDLDTGNTNPQAEWDKRHVAPVPAPKPVPDPTPPPTPTPAPVPVEVPTMEEFVALGHRLDDLSNNVAALSRKYDALASLADEVAALQAVRDKVRAAIA